MFKELGHKVEVFFRWVSIRITRILRFLTHDHVHTKHAFKSALLSGIVFTAVQYLYLETQVMVAKQSAVYGVLAAIPLFMIWLDLGWSIILSGAELSYAFQNVDQHKITIEKLDQMNAEAVRERKERFQNTMTL